MLFKILHFITSLPINCSVTVVKLLHNYVIEDPFLYIGQLLNFSNFTIFCEKNWRIGCIQVFKTKVIILFSLFVTSMLIKYCIIVCYNFFSRNGSGCKGERGGSTKYFNCSKWANGECSKPFV